MTPSPMCLTSMLTDRFACTLESVAMSFVFDLQDFSDEQKTILVQNYISRIKSKLTPSNFQQLITAKLGASFLGNLPSDFLAKDPIFDDGSVIRNVFVPNLRLSSTKKHRSFPSSATWLRFLSPLQRDAISSKMYHALTDTTGKMAAGNAPTRLTSEDANTLDMIARTMPSLSTRQIINAVGDRIVSCCATNAVRGQRVCLRFHYSASRVRTIISRVRPRWRCSTARLNRRRPAIDTFDRIYSERASLSAFRMRVVSVGWFNDGRSATAAVI